MAYDFSGKRALVTGAGRGIGKEIVKELVKCNAEVIALDIIQDNLKSLKDEIPSVDIVCVDLSNWKETRAAVESLGVIDLLVNNAGIVKLGSFEEITEEDIDGIIAVNVKPIINVSQVVVKALKEHGKQGSIVNVASLTATKYFPSVAIYSATKATINRLTKTMAVELGPYGIRVNDVNPYVCTELTSSPVSKDQIENVKRVIPLRRIAEKRDVASAVAFLLSDKAGMVNGTCLLVDGGHRVA